MLSSREKLPCKALWIIVSGEAPGSPSKSTFFPESYSKNKPIATSLIVHKRPSRTTVLHPYAEVVTEKLGFEEDNRFVRTKQEIKEGHVVLVEDPLAVWACTSGSEKLSSEEMSRMTNGLGLYLVQKNQDLKFASELSQLHPRVVTKEIQEGYEEMKKEGFKEHIAMRFSRILRKVAYNAFNWTDCALALYITGSFINHSCDPNCGWGINPQGQLVIAALRPLQTEEEITIDYIETKKMTDVLTRQARLAQCFGFLCRCTRCTKEEQKLFSRITQRVESN